MAKLNTSVVLACYEPTQFLMQQLESLGRQTRLPDELVLVDDHSPGGLSSMVTDFCRSLPFKTTMLRNPVNLGVTANFEMACRSASGDVLFLCDQDDIWEPRKIEIMAEKFSAESDLLFLFTDAIVTDADLRPKAGLFAANSFSSQERSRIRTGRSFEVLLRRAVVTGATSAFRRIVFERGSPFPESYWFHDEWLALVSSFIGRIDFLEAKLIRYRQHENNVVGSSGISKAVRQRLAMHAVYYEIEVARYEYAVWAFPAIRAAGPCGGHAEEKLDLLVKKLEFLRTRSQRPHNLIKRLPYVARALADYKRFSLGYRSAGIDLLPHFVKRR